MEATIKSASEYAKEAIDSLKKIKKTKRAEKKAREASLVEKHPHLWVSVGIAFFVMSFFIFLQIFAS